MSRLIIRAGPCRPGNAGATHPASDLFRYIPEDLFQISFKEENHESFRSNRLARVVVFYSRGSSRIVYIIVAVQPLF